MSGLAIETVADGSPAGRAGLLPGDRLLRINGKAVRDVIDYSYLIFDDEPELLLEDRTGARRHVTLSAAPGEPTGISFAPPEPKRCGNSCIFCFVHQLPKGLRRSLYVKDEDYRLSFLQGTYVTLTNIKGYELRRIISQRLSPLYISVHATDPLIREQMLGRTGILPILEQLETLARGRIMMHTQVVLCPGINDGPTLERTVNDLSALYPAIQSLAIVPLGVTSHRQKLPALASVDRDYSENFLKIWLPKMRALNKRVGMPFLQIADEFFLKAGCEFPKLNEYGELPQWENGVGMVPLFNKEAASAVKRAKPLPRKIDVTVATGQSALDFTGRFVADLNIRTGSSIKAVAIPNRLFGETVTVTGLVCGRDIISALEGIDIGEALLIPSVMLKDCDGSFLDDLTPSDIASRLSRKVISFDGTPSGLYRTIRQMAKKAGERVADL